MRTVVVVLVYPLNAYTDVATVSGRDIRRNAFSESTNSTLCIVFRYAVLIFEWVVLVTDCSTG
jgi:hypothetical protein